MKENNLSDRLLRFSVQVILFLRKLPYNDEYKIIKNQLIKSSTSSGANYEEAQGASSKADFTNKVRISLKEMRESNYWLKVIKGILTIENAKEDCILLIKESKELKNILGAICSKTERKYKP
jgi:four helix bundle protein